MLVISIAVQYNEYCVPATTASPSPTTPAPAVDIDRRVEYFQVLVTHIIIVFTHGYCVSIIHSYANLLCIGATGVKQSIDAVIPPQLLVYSRSPTASTTHTFGIAC